MVKANRQKYSVRAMCSLLKISRNACYYTKKEKKCDTELENEIIRIFRSSRDCYGTRKIKRALGGRAVSRRYIANVMKKYGLVSKYTQRQFKRQPLDRIAIFHTDRGSEFKNECIDRIIKAFGIRRSLSRKGCPYDNAVAEATYSIFKADFVAGSSFSSLKELERTLNDYVLWYNNVRLHGSLGYLSPVCLPSITKSTCPINFGT